MSRQFFIPEEKKCLQELIVKYKLNSTATITAGNPVVKRTAWAKLTNEFNSIESNTKRTEAQLKKCFDNMKTRRKTELLSQKKDRMRTGGGPHQKSPEPEASTSQDSMLIDTDVLAELTDIEMIHTIDSDTVNAPVPDDSGTEYVVMVPQETSEEQFTETLEELNNPVSGVDRPVTGQRRSSIRTSSRLSDHGVVSSGARNIRAQVIQDEFNLREETYKRAQERENELHRLKVAEREWMVKTAEVNYKRACLELEAAQFKLDELKKYFFVLFNFLLIVYLGKMFI